MPTGMDINSLLRLLQPNQGLNLPQLGLGTALLGSTLLGRDEPGYVTEARQNVRNLSSPTGFGSGFTNTVGALKSQFQPLLEQQRDKSFNEISQRYTAAFPGTVGAQPQEFGAFANYLRDQYEPGTQAFYGNLGMQGLNTQYQAASKILDSAKPDPFKEGLAALAGSLILGGMGNGGSGLGGLGGLLGGGQQGGLLQQLLGGGGAGTGLLGGAGGLPGVGPGGVIGNLFQGQGLTNSGVGNLSSLGALFSGGQALQQGLGLLPGAATGAFSTLSPAAGQALMTSLNGMLGTSVGALEAGANGSVIALGEGGQALATILPNGQVVAQGGGLLGTTGASAAGGTGGFFSPAAAGTTGLQGLFGGTGLLGAPGFGTLQGLLSGAGSGLAGFGLGNLIGGQMPGSSLPSAGAVVGAGALSGFVLGGPIGAAIGALAGLGGGLLGSHNAEVAKDARIHAVDLQAAGTNKDSIGSFWTEAIGAAGGNTTAFYNQVKSFGPGDVDKVAAAGAGELLKSINASRTAQGMAPINSLEQAGPEFRQGYIDYIMQNNRIEQGGKLSAPGDISQQAQLLAMAGFKVPGNPGVLAVAGEDTGHTISQGFRNPDQPSQAEADELWSKVVALKPGASKPGDWYNMPGAIMNQRAAQLIRS